MHKGTGQRTQDKRSLGLLVGPGRAREDLMGCMLLGAIVLVLFGRVPLNGLVLTPADNIFLTPFFAPEVPPGFEHPGNPLLFDQTYQFVPWRRFSWEAVRQGHLPLWNPYSHAGAPFVATMSSAVFYPINMLLSLLPLEQTFAWSAILKLWSAGVLTYLLARRYGLGWSASGVSAVAFMLSGFMVVWLGHPQTNVAVWLPGLMLLGELLVAARNRAERLRYSALLALVIGVQFTGGHLETSGDILIAFTLFYLCRWVQVVLRAPEPRGVKLSKLLLLPTAAAVLGASLASIQLLPFLEWLPLSAEFHRRLSETGFQLLNLRFWRYLFFLPLLIFPNLYNNPTWPSPPYRSFLPWGQNFNEDVLYIGVLPFIFAIIALLVRRAHVPDVKVWTVIGLIALGRALHLPVFDWLNQLPLLNVANPHRLRLVFMFSISVLAGFGAQAWWGTCPSLRDRTTRYWQRLCAAVVGLGLLLGIGGNFVLPLLKGALTATARHRAETEFVSQGAAVRPLGYYYALADQAVEKILRTFSIANLSMYLPALIAAAALGTTLWALRRPARRWHMLPVLLLSLTILDLMAFAWRYNPAVPVRTFYPKPELVAMLAQDRSLFRFTATGLDLFPDAHMMFRLSDVRGLDFSTRWYNSYVRMVPGYLPWASYGTLFMNSESPLLRVLNLKYVFSAEPGFPAGNDRADLVYARDGRHLWRLREPQPRSFMVHEAIVVQDDSEAVHLLRREPEAVFTRVVLSQPAPVKTLTRAAQGAPEGPGSDVAVVDYEAIRSVWRVSTAEGGYLVTTDTYYPGWHAYLDGVRTPVYRANVAFRAVEVPPGEHTVVYRYEPRWLLIAVVLGCLSAFIITVELIWAAVLAHRGTTNA